MDKIQAEKIVNKYGAAIANDKNFFKKKSSLPCSKAKIRYAFYVHIKSIVEEAGALPKNLGSTLVNTYSMLDAFMDDEEANRLNSRYDALKKLDLKEPDEKREFEDIGSRIFKAIRNGDYFDEINEYIGECYEEKNSGSVRYTPSAEVEALEEEIERIFEKKET